MKIILAEDDATTRLIMTHTLERWGYDVLATQNGEQAWKAATAYGVRLIISDWEMPELDGLQLCRRIRASEEGRFVYILLLTLHNDPERIVSALEAGADDFVSKPFNPGELRARLGVGRRILALQEELAQKNQALEQINIWLAHQASTDPLTQIGNRRGFEGAIIRTHSRATEYKQAYGLVLVDVDHFKSFNDRFGHAYGDRVLSSIAETLRNTARSQAELFRYGGEEMILIVPDHSQDELMKLAERLRQAIETSQPADPMGPEARVTASFGCAHYDGTADVTWRMLVERADSALYAAKAAGRNCVRLFGPENQESHTDAPNP